MVVVAPTSGPVWEGVLRCWAWLAGSLPKGARARGQRLKIFSTPKNPKHDNRWASPKTSQEPSRPCRSFCPPKASKGLPFTGLRASNAPRNLASSGRPPRHRNLSRAFFQPSNPNGRPSKAPSERTTEDTDEIVLLTKMDLTEFRP